MSGIYELERITADISSVRFMDIDTHLDRQALVLPRYEYFRRKALLEATRDLVKLGLYDDTPRVYGATEYGELKFFPHFKLRTYPRPTAETNDRDNHHHILGLSNKHVLHNGRTKTGKILEKFSIDEMLPAHLAIGTHGLYGNARPPLVSEYLSERYKDHANKFGMEPLDTAQRLQVGIFTVMATLNGRILDNDGWPKYMRALTIPEDEWPSHAEMRHATLDKSFRQQTAGNIQMETADALETSGPTVQFNQEYNK